MTEFLENPATLDDDEIRHAKLFLSELLILGELEVKQLRDLQKRLAIDTYDAMLLENRGLSVDTRPFIDSIEKEIDVMLEEKVTEVNTYLLTVPELAVEVISGADRITVDSVVRMGDAVVPVVGDELYTEDIKCISVGSDVYKLGAKSVYLADTV